MLTKRRADGGAEISMSHFPGVKAKNAGSPSFVIAEYFDVKEPAVWLVGKSASPENKPFLWPKIKWNKIINIPNITRVFIRKFVLTNSLTFLLASSK